MRIDRKLFGALRRNYIPDQSVSYIRCVRIDRKLFGALRPHASVNFPIGIYLVRIDRKLFGALRQLTSAVIIYPTIPPCENRQEALRGTTTYSPAHLGRTGGPQMGENRQEALRGTTTADVPFSPEIQA